MASSQASLSASCMSVSEESDDGCWPVWKALASEVLMLHSSNMCRLQVLLHIQGLMQRLFPYSLYVVTLLQHIWPCNRCCLGLPKCEFGDVHFPNRLVSLGLMSFLSSSKRCLPFGRRINHIEINWYFASTTARRQHHINHDGSAAMNWSLTGVHRL